MPQHSLQDGWASTGKLTLHYQHCDCCCWAALAVLFVQETPKPHETKNHCLIQVYYNPHLSLEVNEQSFLRTRALGRLAFTEYEDLTPLLKYNLQPYQKCPSDIFYNTHYAQSSLAAVAKVSSTDPPAPHTGSGDEALPQESLVRALYQFCALPLMWSDSCRMQGRHRSAGRKRQQAVCARPLCTSPQL